MSSLWDRPFKLSKLAVAFLLLILVDNNSTAKNDGYFGDIRSLIHSNNFYF